MRNLLVLVALVALVVLVSVVLEVGRSPRRSAAETLPASSERDTRPTPPGPTQVAVPARRLASLVSPEAPGQVRLPSGRLVRIRPVSRTRTTRASY